MHDHRVFLADLELELPDRLQERQPLDVAHGAADFCDEYVARMARHELVDARLDLIRDVRDDLHGLAEKFARTLLCEDGLVDLSARGIARPRERAVREPLVVAEVEIRLRAVVEHIHFAVLKRVHRAGIHVQIRIEFLQRDLQPAALEQCAERCGRDALAE